MDVSRLADKIKLLGYSLDVVSTPEVCALLERLEGHASEAFAATSRSVFPCMERRWRGGGWMGMSMGMDRTGRLT